MEARDGGGLPRFAIAIIVETGRRVMLTEPSVTLDDPYPLTGPEALGMAEVAEKLSSVTGKTTGKTIRYVDAPPEQAREARLAAGMKKTPVRKPP